MGRAFAYRERRCVDCSQWDSSWCKEAPHPAQGKLVLLGCGAICYLCSQWGVVPAWVGVHLQKVDSWWNWFRIFFSADKTMWSKLASLFTQGWHWGLSLNWVPPHCIVLGKYQFKSKRSSHGSLLKEEGLTVSPWASVRPGEGRDAENFLILHRREEAM